MEKPGYSFVDATFAFFKAVGRRPLGALWITLWQLILYSVLVGLIFAFMVPFLMLVLSAEIQGREIELAQILGAASGVIAGIVLATLGMMAAALMVQAAWLRLLARDEIARIIPLRFGADELRLLVVNAAFVVFNIFGWSAVVLVFAVTNGIILAAVGSGADGVGATLAAALLNILLALAIGVAAVILILRFAAAPGLSVRQRGVKLFESVSATRGVAGWMFVSYVTIIVLYVVGYVLVATVQNVVLLLAAADLVPTLTALENTDDPALVLQMLGDIVTRPSMITAFVLVILIQIPLQIAFEGSWHGVGAYVARRHAGDFPSDAVHTPTGSVGAAPTRG
jgi:hypothetical protein